MADSLIFEIADRLEPQIKNAFLAMVDAAVEIIPLTMIEDAVRQGNRVFLAEMVSVLAQRGMVTNTQQIMAIFESAIKAGAIAGGVGVGGMFELKSPRTAAWILEHTGGFITGLIGESVTGIRNVILSGQLEGLTVPNQAQAIRGLVGLTARDAGALANYAVGLEGVVSEARAAQLVDLYRHRLLNARATMIARTETARATLAGQYELWRQLFDERVLEIEHAWLRWTVHDDDRLCPYCAPLDGQQVRFGENFTADKKGFPPGYEPENPPLHRTLRPDPWSQPRDKAGRFMAVAKAVTSKQLDKLETIERMSWPDGTLPHPPLHPNCRCIVNLIIE